MTGQLGIRVAQGPFLGALCALTFASVFLSSALAVVTSTTQHGETITAFDAVISDSDLIHGRSTLNVDVYENPQDTFGNPSHGENSWHPANSDPLDRHAAFTDGIGMRSTGLTGLLNDFPIASGSPAKIVQYPFDTPVDIGRINILTGNNNPDGRIFSTTYVEYSTDNGFTIQPLGYFQSDPSGSGNSTNRTTLVSIFDDSSNTMLTGVTDIIFNLYSVSNTALNLQDPFDGVNAFTGVDDGFEKAFESPLVLELDVLPPVEGIDGDYNSDGSVDAADYVMWRKDPEANGGDPDGYNTWAANFGEGGGPGGGNAGGVPEPSALVLLATAMSLSAAVRRRVGPNSL